MKKVLVGLAFTALSAFGQTGAMHGKVVGPDGKPVGKDEVFIQIDRTDIKNAYGVWTDKKGEFFHAGLPAPGKYNITVITGGKKVKNKPEGGKEAAKLEGVSLRGGDPLEIQPFDLKAAEVAAAAGVDPSAANDATRGMTKEQKEAYEKELKDRAATMAKNKELNDAFNLAMAAKEAKNYDEAVSQFVKASTMGADQHVVWANLAETYEALGGTKTGAEQEAAYVKGAEAWDKAIAIKADDPSYHNNYALLLAKSKKFKEAEAELGKAATLNPPGAGMYFYNLGALYTNGGQLEPSGEAFKKAIDADPTHADAQYQYGVYLMSKAQTKADGTVTPVPGTLEAFNKYLELKPTGSFADAAKGMIQMMGVTLDTKYQNPDAKKNTPGAKPPAKKK